MGLEICHQRSLLSYSVTNSCERTDILCRNKIQGIVTFTGSFSDISAALWPFTSSIDTSGAEGASEGAFEVSILFIFIKCNCDNILMNNQS